MSGICAFGKGFDGRGIGDHVEGQAERLDPLAMSGQRLGVPYPPVIFGIGADMVDAELLHHDKIGIVPRRQLRSQVHIHPPILRED